MEVNFLDEADVALAGLSTSGIRENSELKGFLAERGLKLPPHLLHRLLTGSHESLSSASLRLSDGDYGVFYAVESVAELYIVMAGSDAGGIYKDDEKFKHKVLDIILTLEAKNGKLKETGRFLVSGKDRDGFVEGSEDAKRISRMARRKTIPGLFRHNAFTNEDVRKFSARR